MDRIAQRYGGQGLAVVGVNTSDEAGNAAPFARKHHLSYPIAYDEGAASGERVRRGWVADAGDHLEDGQGRRGPDRGDERLGSRCAGEASALNRSEPGDCGEGAAESTRGTVSREDPARLRVLFSVVRRIAAMVTPNAHPARKERGHQWNRTDSLSSESLQLDASSRRVCLAVAVSRPDWIRRRRPLPRESVSASPSNMGRSGARRPPALVLPAELEAAAFRVVYAPSAERAAAHVPGRAGRLTFRGSDISSIVTPAGTFVTVTTRMTIDSGSTTFSLLSRA